jgi:EmrB/QacA subfamily drug resistance transporter
MSVAATSTQPGTTTASQIAGPSKWLVLTVVGIGTFMTTLDSSIVNISLPAIAHSFGVPLSGVVEWVIIAYLVVIAGTLLTFGRLSDMIGRKPVFVAGLVIFTIGSALCGLAPSVVLLIVARCFQGLGGALIFAPSVALLTDAFPLRERGRAIGLNAVVVSVGISAGPALGGLITQYLDWRWIFYVNLPVGILGLLLAGRVLPAGHRSPARFDFLGALCLGVGLAGLTLALSFGQEWGWTSPTLLLTVAIALGALIALVPVERHTPNPNVDLDLVTQRPFAAALTSLVLNFLALFAVGFLMPFYFENLRSFSAETAGLLLTPQAVAIAIVAPISGSLADRFGSRWLASIGLAIGCVGLLLVAQLGLNSTIPDIVWRLVLVGVGMGLFQSPNNRAIMSAAPPRAQGQASGLLGTGRVVGQALSIAFAGAIFSYYGGTDAMAMLSQAANLPADQVAALQQIFVTAYHNALIGSALVAALGIFTSLVRGRA